MEVSTEPPAAAAGDPASAGSLLWHSPVHRGAAGVAPPPATPGDRSGVPIGPASTAGATATGSPSHASASSPASGASALRTFDDDGYCRRAGVLAYTLAAEAASAPDGTAAPSLAAADADPLAPPPHPALRLLLVASSSRPDCWILPGGGIDPGESEAAAAAREAHEEAGAVVAAPAAAEPDASAPPPPPVLYLATVTNHAKHTRTRLFALRVARLEDAGTTAAVSGGAVGSGAYADAGVRQRRWATLDEAAALLVGSKSNAHAASLAAAMAALGWGPVPTALAAAAAQSGVHVSFAPLHEVGGALAHAASGLPLALPPPTSEGAGSGDLAAAPR